MSNIIFEPGDFVSTKHGKVWYGVVLERKDHVPKAYPVYANKYKVKWAAGAVSWQWGANLDLVSRQRSN